MDNPKSIYKPLRCVDPDPVRLVDADLHCTEPSVTVSTMKTFSKRTIYLHSIPIHPIMWHVFVINYTLFGRCFEILILGGVFCMVAMR